MVFRFLYNKNTYVDLHLSVQSIVEQKIMGHAYAMRLHGMALPIIIIADVTWKLSIILDLLMIIN